MHNDAVTQVAGYANAITSIDTASLVRAKTRSALSRQMLANTIIAGMNARDTPRAIAPCTSRIE